MSVERTDPVVGQRIARHTFLRLRQPVNTDAYPASRILKPGITYRFPFLFVIPERLLPKSCDHKVTDSHVQQTHTQLPPTFGDSSACGSGLTDIAPDTCQIYYVIRARILKGPPGKNALSKPLVDLSQQVHVVPSIDQEFPRNPSEKVLCHSIQSEKRIKSGLINGSQGRLKVTASQPEPVLLDLKGTSKNMIDTATVVHLQFEPKTDEQPPQLSTLRSKLGIRTFYGCTPWAGHPLDAAQISEKHQDMTLEHVPLSSFRVSAMEWTKHSASNEQAYDQPWTEHCNYSGKVYYTTSITVPIYLPRDRQFVPTFYSCLISRIYTLDLCLSYHTPKTRILRHCLNLKVPLTLNVAAPELGDSSSNISCRKDAVQSCSHDGFGDWKHKKSHLEGWM